MNNLVTNPSLPSAGLQVHLADSQVQTCVCQVRLFWLYAPQVFSVQGSHGEACLHAVTTTKTGSQCCIEPNLSGIGPVVPSSCREALFSSQTRASGWLDAVSCALCLRLLVLFGDIEFVVLGRSKIRDLTILTLFVKSQAWRASATFSASTKRGFYTLI